MPQGDGNFSIRQGYTGPLDDARSEVLDRARRKLKAEHDEGIREREGRRLARRLIIAFVLVMVTGITMIAILPSFGIHLPMPVVLLALSVIIVGSIMSFMGDHPVPTPADEHVDAEATDGCAVGMCPGPRPLRMFSDPKQPREDR